jgi:hypothetical protein
VNLQVPFDVIKQYRVRLCTTVQLGLSFSSCLYKPFAPPPQWLGEMRSIGTNKSKLHLYTPRPMSARRCPAPGHGKRSCPSSYFVNARVCDFAARHSKDPLGAHAGQTLTYHRAYIVDISPYLKVVANQPYGSPLTSRANCPAPQYLLSEMPPKHVLVAGIYETFPPQGQCAQSKTKVQARA